VPSALEPPRENVWLRAWAIPSLAGLLVVLGESGPQWPPVHSGHIVILTHSAYRLACDLISAIAYLAVYTPLLCFWREVRLELKYRVLLVLEVHKFIFAFPV